MLFRGIFDLVRLLCSIAFSMICEAITLLVYLIGAPGVAIIVIALLWWFDWLPDIIDYTASFFG